MNRLTHSLAAIFVLTLCLSTNISAAIVIFTGQLTSGNGVLGAVPPSTQFSLFLDFSATSPGFGTINSGMFNSSPGNIPVVSGDILLIENGANDQALFSINTTAPTGSISITATGNGFTNNQVTTQNLVSLINASAFTSVSANFGANGNYTGSISSAVPEPGSALLLSAAGLGLSLARRRRRRSV